MTPAVEISTIDAVTVPAPFSTAITHVSFAAGLKPAGMVAIDVLAVVVPPVMVPYKRASPEASLMIAGC
jgi:hypothetical protein